MALEDFKAQIALLLDEAAERPEDTHALQEQIREQLAVLKAMGMPLPQDLVDLEQALEEDFEEAVRRRRGLRQPPPSPIEAPDS